MTNPLVAIAGSTAAGFFRRWLAPGTGGASTVFRLSMRAFTSTASFAPGSMVR